MNSRFSTLPHAAMYVSLCILTLQAVLAVLVWKHKLHRNYPAFAVYAYISLVKGLAMFWIAGACSGETYRQAYYISSAVLSILIGLCTAEIYLKIFGPRIALPPETFRNIAVLILAIMTTSIVASSLMGSLKGDFAARFLWTAEQGIFAASCAAIVAMMAYSRRLEISWPKRVAGMAQAFVLQLAVNMTAAVVIGRATYAVSIAAAFVGQFANLAALLWWIQCFWEREPVEADLTPKMLETVLDFHRQTVEADTTLDQSYQE